jgi:uncharacterized membrane protein
MISETFLWLSGFSFGAAAATVIFVWMLFVYKAVSNLLELKALKR